MSQVGEAPRTMGRPHSGEWRSDAFEAANYLGSGVLGGLIAGFLIGGVGSRLAMMALRFTAGDSVVGLESDDGFTIGQLSGATFFLLLFATAVGVAGSIVYLLARAWIPPRWRAASFGLLGALVGGSALVHASGIDFSLLTPVWLAVLMFVALPALGGAVLSLLVERLLRRDAERDGRRPWLLFVPLLGLAFIGPLGLAVAVITSLAVALNAKVHWAKLWTSPALTWIGRTLLMVWGLSAANALMNDLRAIF